MHPITCLNVIKDKAHDTFYTRFNYLNFVSSSATNIARNSSISMRMQYRTPTNTKRSLATNSFFVLHRSTV